MDDNGIQQLKEKLDKLNYGKSLIVDRNVLLLQNVNCYYDSEILKAGTVGLSYNYLLEKLKNKNKEYFIGTISTGTHSLDYANYYDFNIYDDWHKEPVMYVYECPADNSDKSYAYDENNEKPSYTRLIESQNDFDKHLCRVLWHVDNERSPNPHAFKDDNSQFNYFSAKEYGLFMASIVNEFKLANFYTTNMFRYEVFEVGKDKKGIDKETALNLPSIASTVYSIEDTKKWRIEPNRFEFLNVFYEELKLLSPKVIFATSNPFKILSNLKDNQNSRFYEYLRNTVLVKLPHPANRDTLSERYLKNTMNIIRGLSAAGIISNDENTVNKLVSKAFDNYTAFGDIIYPNQH